MNRQGTLMTPSLVAEMYNFRHGLKDSSRHVLRSHPRRRGQRLQDQQVGGCPPGAGPQTAEARGLAPDLRGGSHDGHDPASVLVVEQLISSLFHTTGSDQQLA